jgi:predicted dehydrogenase
MIGLGFAGAGWLGEALIRDLESFPQLRLVGVQDARPELAARVAQHYGADWHGTSFDDLLAQPDIDVVAISTPNGLHASQAQASLCAGKHVLVQKPLGLTQDEAAGTLALAQKAGRLLFVDYSYRFLDTMDALRRRLAEAGRVERIRADFHNIYGPGPEKAWFFDPRLSGGGALVDLGVHLLDLALWLVTPRRVELRHSSLVREPGQSVEHAADVGVQLDEVPLELSVSWNAMLPETVIAMELQTARGCLRWENVDGSFFHFRTRDAERVLCDRETTLRQDTLRALCAALDSGTAPAIDTRVYAVLDQAYARGVRTGD